MERQPTRSKRVREDRRFDRTQLRANGHGRTVHRDYASHVFRWHFAAQYVQDLASLDTCFQNLEVLKNNATSQEETDRIMRLENYTQEIFLKYGWVQRQITGGIKILDIGCGQDQPLLYVLGARVQTAPQLYVGVDLNRILRPSQVKWAKIHDQFDFVNNGEKLRGYGEFDLVTCFEVIEHMSVEDGGKLLAQIRSFLKPNGRLFLSTPVFNGLAAANHIHEYTIQELGAQLKDQKFNVLKRFGTFASKPDIYYALSLEQRSTYDQLEKWYGNEVMSCLYAPLYPDHSRNNLWICSKNEEC